MPDIKSISCSSKATVYYLREQVMYLSEEIIKQLQDNNILAANALDRAVAGVRDAVRDQIEKIDAGKTRLINYGYCFTTEFYEKCTEQKSEDQRFIAGIYHLLKNKAIFTEMLEVYFEVVFKGRDIRQLQNIKRMLMQLNIHIAASTLTSRTFALGVAMALSMSLHVSLPFSRLTGTTIGAAASILGVYGIVQQAADSANHLKVLHPDYYQALYTVELEMMFFLIEDKLLRAGALQNRWLADDEVADIIYKLVRLS